MGLINYNKKIFGVTYSSHPILFFIEGFVLVFSGILAIITFGLYKPVIHLNFRIWLMIKGFDENED